MLVLIDNYDSFVHNLARYCAELGCDTRVVRNDAMSVDDVLRMSPEAIIVSPGPGTPADAGISEELCRRAGEIPLLGVCLGHQAIASSAGATIIRASRPVHGQSSIIEHDGKGLFADIPNPLRVMRYHSLIIDEPTLPDDYSVTARFGSIPMAIQHVSRPLFGVQFHPEAVLTQSGHRLLANFLSVAGLATSIEFPHELQTEIDESFWEQDFESEYPSAQKAD
ncbi:MAG: aminodeoxychorismate/anthranilate synthase component II [Planctomycetaceae bacterium]